MKAAQRPEQIESLEAAGGQEMRRLVEFAGSRVEGTLTAMCREAQEEARADVWRRQERWVAEGMQGEEPFVVHRDIIFIRRPEAMRLED